MVITGLSGSGKSSLAFDTLYAEGQRRYVESLSAYARQFLGQMDKPDVDHIEGLSPAISIDQKTTSRNPRSTVATVTEIYDYLRLLFARVGEPHCPICGRPIAGQSVEQITDQVLTLPEGTRFLVLAPLVRDRKGEHRDVLEHIRAEGFSRVAVDGTTYVLDEVPALDKKFSHTIEVVVDRLVMNGDLRRRLSDSLETATRMADGLVRIEEVPRDGSEPRSWTYSEKFACPEHGASLPELAPRTFSFNSPHGACPQCTGLGFTQEVDPELVVDPERTLAEGAILPWTDRTTDYYDLLLGVIATQHEIDLNTPWRSLPAVQPGAAARRAAPARAGLPGHEAAQGGQLGLVRGRGAPTAAPARHLDVPGRARQRGAVHVAPAVPGLRRRAAEARVTGRHDHRAQHPPGLPAVRVGRPRLLHRPGAERHPGLHRRAHHPGDPRAPPVPRRRRGRLPRPGARRGDAVGRRGPAHPARHPDRVRPGGRALHPGRAVHRPPPARQPQADRHAGAPARPGQHGPGGGARRGHDPQRRACGGHGPGRRPARRPGGGPGHGGGHRGRAGVGDRRLPVRAPRRAGAHGAPRAARPADGPRRAREQPARHRRRLPDRRPDLRDRRLRVGQEHAGERGAAEGALGPPRPAAAAPGRPRPHRRARAHRQGHRHRPVAHRSDAAQQPGHLHGRLRPHPPALLHDPGGADARLLARALQLQRQGRPLRGVQGRRHDQHRDALPARRVRPVRGVRRPALSTARRWTSATAGGPSPRCST